MLGRNVLDQIQFCSQGPSLFNYLVNSLFGMFPRPAARRKSKVGGNVSLRRRLRMQLKPRSFRVSITAAAFGRRGGGF